MISVEEARRRLLRALEPLPSEQIAVAGGLGRVLSRDVAARRTQPPLPVSAMDGYAVRAADVETLPATLEVVGYAPAGKAFSGAVGPGQAVRIFTGAPVPAGADAIVIQENTRGAPGAKRVAVLAGSTPPGRYVRPAGLDFSEGDVLLEAGRALTARDLGLAAAMNVSWIMVRRRPRVAILATGDEIVMPGDPIGPDQIVSSNAMALAGFVTALGGVPVDLGIAPDSPEALRAMAGGARGADLVVTTGGASVGDHDLVKSVLGEAGLEIDFWRIAMRPGKPLIFGRLSGTPLLGLPGNPVSAMVCALIFLRPAMEKLSGANRGAAPGRETAVLGADLLENDEREDYLRGTLARGEDGRLRATPFAVQDSSMFANMARAECLIVRTPHAPAQPAESEVEILPLGLGFDRT